MKPDKGKFLRPLMGVGWYRRDQWQQLREAAADPTELEARWEDWQKEAAATFEGMVRAGTPVERVDVDVTDLILWCRATKRPLDKSGRARYISEKLKARHLQRAHRPSKDPDPLPEG
ncbi:MAG: hypothetical protein HUU15_15905 [Candidatus Brocadiae bacterium]|nr:hypothetical protein [Candidatus Brocadiia bacterium]